MGRWRCWRSIGHASRPGRHKERHGFDRGGARDLISYDNTFTWPQLALVGLALLAGRCCGWSPTTSRFQQRPR
jgi:hypothetical protein